MINEKTTEDEEDEVIYGESPSIEDEIYSDLGKNMTKETLPFLNSTLRHFVTLNSAFVAGAVAIYDKAVINKSVAILSMIFFIVALTVSIFGMLPFASKIRIGNLTDVKNAFENGVSMKRNILYVTSVLFLCGIGTILIGIIANSHSN